MAKPIVATLALVAACCAIGCGGETTDVLHGERFALAVEQGGRRVAIHENQATIAREPFAIVLAMPQLTSVLVSASPTGESVQQARAGAPMERIEGFSGRQIAEDLFNPDRVLALSQRDFHNWFYMGPRNHRYDDVRQEQEVFLCRRGVEGVRLESGGAARALSHYDGEVIYLVLISTDWSADRTRRVETQRQHLTLRLR